jgi:hypothetical protein
VDFDRQQRPVRDYHKGISGIEYLRRDSDKGSPASGSSVIMGLGGRHAGTLPLKDKTGPGWLENAQQGRRGGQELASAPNKLRSHEP